MCYWKFVQLENHTRFSSDIYLMELPETSVYKTEAMIQLGDIIIMESLKRLQTHIQLLLHLFHPKWLNEIGIVNYVWHSDLLLSVPKPPSLQNFTAARDTLVMTTFVIFSNVPPKTLVGS